MHKATTRHNGHAYSKHSHTPIQAKKFLLAQYKKIKSKPIATTQIALGIGVISALALWYVLRK